MPPTSFIAGRGSFLHSFSIHAAAGLLDALLEPRSRFADGFLAACYHHNDSKIVTSARLLAGVPVSAGAFAQLIDSLRESASSVIAFRIARKENLDAGEFILAQVVRMLPRTRREFGRIVVLLSPHSPATFVSLFSTFVTVTPSVFRDLPPDWRASSSQALLEVERYTHSGGDDPETKVRRALLALGYPQVKARSLFDAESKRVKRRKPST
jgi:hypothetical protein